MFCVNWRLIFSNAGRIKIRSSYLMASYSEHGDYVLPNYVDIRMQKRDIEEHGEDASCRSGRTEGAEKSSVL
jgi:hypothetical protein